jgi:uncharacterized alpha-E superfamily protein
VRLSWDSLLAIMGAEPTDEPATRNEVVTRLTLDPDDPAAILHCVARAREGARTVRDVFSAEMWEAVNTFHMGLLRQDLSDALRAGPYSIYALVRERCGLFWGVTRRTMLRDEAHAFLQAGAAMEDADMVVRMLRVALPEGSAGGEAEDHRRDGQALAVLQAVGGLQAFRRAVPAPPLAGPVARFLLYERSYPDSVACSVDVLHEALTAADTQARTSPPVLRAGRLLADLEFRSRAPDADGDFQHALTIVQGELALTDGDIGQRYFGGAAFPSVVNAYA